MGNHSKLAVLVLTLILLSLTGKILAVTVSPAKIEIKADPGNIIEGRVSVFNEGEETRTFYADFEKFTELNGERKFLPGEEAELANWFQMERIVSLEPKERKDIPYTIEVPENAPPGGHFAVIWWGTAPPEGKQVAIVTRAGILVFLEISGEVNEKGKISIFSLPKGKFFVFQLPENFTVEFKNDGNTYLKPLGKIAIKNIFGSTIASFSVNEKERNILPDNTRALETAPEFQKKPFAFGLYYAELNLQWGKEQNSFRKNVYFFVFPWKIVLISLIILTVLAFLLTKGIKKYNQWIINKSAEQTDNLKEKQTAYKENKTRKQRKTLK